MAGLNDPNQKPIADTQEARVALGAAISISILSILAIIIMVAQLITGG